MTLRPELMDVAIGALVFLGIIIRFVFDRHVIQYWLIIVNIVMAAFLYKMGYPWIATAFALSVPANIYLITMDKHQ